MHGWLPTSPSRTRSKYTNIRGHGSFNMRLIAILIPPTQLVNDEVPGSLTKKLLRP